MWVVLDLQNESSLVEESASEKEACDNGDDCVRKKVLGLKVAGAPMKKVNIPSCILCERASGQKRHFTIVEGYPLAMVVSGEHKIRFDKNDYIVNHHNGDVKMKIEEMQPVFPITWKTTAFILFHTKQTISPWFLDVCESQKCRRSKIKTHVDKKYSFGSKGKYYDCADDRHKCSNCASDIVSFPSSINQKNGRQEVVFDTTTYTTCFNCASVIVAKKENELLPSCTYCEREGKRTSQVLSTSPIYIKI